MGGSSKKTTVGYKRYARILLAIGNTIECLIGLNIDKREWFFFDESQKIVEDSVVSGHYRYINSENLFGSDEGGVSGKVSVYTGSMNQLAHKNYADYLESVNLPRLSYPGLAYLSFDGLENSSRGFYFGNSGFMKEMMIWPKRVNIQPDGSPQWYIEKAAINSSSVSAGIFDSSLLKVIEGITDLSQLAPYAALSLDESTWVEAPGPYGNSGTGTHVDPKPNRAILLRRWISIYDIDSNSQLVVKIKHDDGAVIFVNGIQYSMTVDDYYNSTAIIPASALVNGANLIFAAAVDTVPSGSPAGIHLQLAFDIEAQNVSISDLNIAHKIREIFTSDLALNYDESEINDENFRRAADVFYLEGLGISWLVQQKDCGEALEELCYHGECGVRRNRQSGLVEIIPFRDNWFDVSTLKSFNDSDHSDLEIGWINMDETINSLNVSWYNYNRLKTESFVNRNLGAFYSYGDEIADDADFKWFTSKASAFKVSSWKLKYASTPHIKGSMNLVNTQARSINRFDEILISSKVDDIENLRVRVLKIDLGDGSESHNTKIEFEQVLPIRDTDFGYSYDKPEKPDKSIKPCDFEITELSYRDLVLQVGQASADLELQSNNLYSKPAVVAQRTQSNSINASVYFDGELEGFVDYSFSAQLESSIDKIESELIVTNVAALSSLSVDDVLLLDGERLVVKSIDTSNHSISVGRGADFTMPAAHVKGARMYALDNFAFIAPSDYSAGEQVISKVAPTTVSGELALSEAIQKTKMLLGLPSRPLPPGDVMIDGQYFPNVIDYAVFDVSWVHRNRLLQTSSPVVSFYDSGVILENGVEYVVSVSDEYGSIIYLQNVGSANIATIDLSTSVSKVFKLKIVSVRDQLECVQPFEHVFEISSYFSAPYDLTVEFKND